MVEEIDNHWVAMTSQLLSSPECKKIADLYDQVNYFRSTIDMARYHFGSGQYRYFDTRCPNRWPSFSGLLPPPTPDRSGLGGEARQAGAVAGHARAVVGDVSRGGADEADSDPACGIEAETGSRCIEISMAT